MAYEHKEGQGSLFANEKKNDRQPDYRGTIMIKGVVYEIVGWRKTSKNGMTYMSLQASELSQEPKARGGDPQKKGAAKRTPSPTPSAEGNPFGEPECDFPF